MIDCKMTLRPNSMWPRWFQSACLWALLAAAAVLTPIVALAQEEDVKHDARLEGYTSNVALESGDSTALTWLLLVFIAMIALGVMFKNAKRTHLD